MRLRKTQYDRLTTVPAPAKKTCTWSHGVYIYSSMGKSSLVLIGLVLWCVGVHSDDSHVGDDKREEMHRIGGLEVFRARNDSEQLGRDSSV